jgi:hypothetical protein
MANGPWMARFARWHIWLGWLVGVPLLLWTISGVAMVARPIEEVRGEHLRVNRVEALPLGNPAPVLNQMGGTPTVKEVRSFVQRGQPVTLVTRLDGSVERWDAMRGTRLQPIDELEARAAVRAAIKGGNEVVSVRATAAEAPPIDFRKPVSAWQVALRDGTYVYVNRDSGEIEAVRTRWWRIYDFLWGIHIMDLKTREDSHNPFVIAFGLLALFGALLGCVLLFRRRKARVGA